MILLIPSTGSRAAAILIYSVKLTEDEEGQVKCSKVMCFNYHFIYEEPDIDLSPSLRTNSVYLESAYKKLCRLGANLNIWSFQVASRREALGSTI